MEGHFGSVWHGIFLIFCMVVRYLVESYFLQNVSSKLSPLPRFDRRPGTSTPLYPGLTQTNRVQIASFQHPALRPRCDTTLPTPPASPLSKSPHVSSSAVTRLFLVFSTCVLARDTRFGWLARMTWLNELPSVVVKTSIASLQSSFFVSAYKAVKPRLQ